MKRIVIITLIIFGFILSGCGSNSNVDPVTPNDDNTEMLNGYEFLNVTDEVNVTEYKTYQIGLQLVKDNLVVSNANINVEAFDSKYGEFMNMSAVTDENGRVTFEYLPPREKVEDIDINLLYKDNNDSVLKTTVHISFSDDYTGIPEHESLYSLTGVTSETIISNDNQLATINAYVVDKVGIGVSGKTVSITAITDSKYGQIISSSTVQSDESGKVSFIYQAPSDISQLDGNNTIVSIILRDGDSFERQNVLIKFVKVVELEESKPIVIALNAYKEMNLTNNSQSKNITIQVFKDNAPYYNGKVKVMLPSKVFDGVDIGYFSTYEAQVGSDGLAHFTYTGPQDLESLISSGDTSSTFKFYHEDNPTQYQEITMHYVPDNGYTPANYILSSVSQDDKYTMGLENTKSFTLYLKDDKGNNIDSEQIKSISIESTNTVVGMLIDTATQNEVSTLPYSDSEATNEKSFTVKTGTTSGLLPIKIDVTFDDNNGESQSISIMMNLSVFSGPPTAFSISYVGVEHNATIGKYIEKFAVSATDAYNNPVNTRPYISTGALVEYAVDGSSLDGVRTTTSPRLWHGANDSKGTIEQLGSNTAQFTVSTDVFKYLDIDNDRLVLFGAGYVYEALGKWDLASISNNTIELKDSYYGTDRDDLYYAIGHNNRQDLCSEDAREYIGSMKSSTYQLDENGNVLIEFEYDYHLTGKDIMVWVNLTGYQADQGIVTRVGEAQKHTLRGYGLMSRETYTLASGAKNVILPFYIRHENVPEVYRNGHFAFAYHGCQVDSIIDYSNWYDARDCRNEVVYVDLNVSNPTMSDCTIQLVNIEVSPEFRGTNSF
jgi:hypothetical protein